MNPDWIKWKAIPIKRQNDMFLDAAEELLSKTPEGCPNGIAPVNSWVNNLVRFERDQPQNYWQPAWQTLRWRSGDCEDYVMLKRAILMTQGWTEEQLFVIIGQDIIMREQHAVLAVLDNGIMRFLDNRTAMVLNEDQLFDFTPQFAFTTTHSWLYARKS